MREVVDNSIQTRERVDLEWVLEINLDQSYGKSCIVTKFEDSDGNN